MRKVIVDTNIIFSCMLNTQGSIGDLFFNSNEAFEFYSNEYMRFEIRKHWEKLKKISKLGDRELEIVYAKMLNKLSFINEELIPEKNWLKAEKLLIDIDQDDIDFVALAGFLNGTLWTGDKVLHAGLKVKRFRSVCNTEELMKLRLKLLK